MTDKEKILAEIERRWRELADKNVKVGGGKYDIEISTLLSIKNFINSIPEELVREDLEEAAHKYADIRMSNYETAFYAFMSGANWQKEQIQHNTEAAKQFIKDCTRTCSNTLISISEGKKVVSHHEWLTPEQALRAVEIAIGE